MADVPGLDADELKQRAAWLADELLALMEADKYVFASVACDAHIAATYVAIESNPEKAREVLSEIGKNVAKQLARRQPNANLG